MGPDCGSDNTGGTILGRGGSFCGTGGGKMFDCVFGEWFDPSRVWGSTDEVAGGGRSVSTTFSGCERDCFANSGNGEETCSFPESVIIATERSCGGGKRARKSPCFTVDIHTS